MNKEREDMSLIDAYLNGELNEASTKRFHERLETDPLFAELFSEMKVMIAGIRHSSSRQMLDKIRSFEEGLPPVKQVKPGRMASLNKWIYASAALLLILIISSVWFFGELSVNRDRVLFNQYFKPYPNLAKPLTRSSNLPKDDESLAYYYYDLGRYHKAIPLFERIGAQSSKSEALFYLGISYLGNRQFSKGQVTMERYLDEPIDYETEAKWYLTLALVGQGMSSLPYLDELQNDEEFGLQARELAQDLMAGQ